MSAYIDLCILAPKPLKAAPLHPALPFIRNRRIVAFYQNMIRRDRPTMTRATYGYYLRKLHYYRTK